MALYGRFSSLPKSTKMLWEQFLKLRKRRGQKSDANAEFEMRCAVQSNGLLFEYQWPRTERVQGCSLTSLCAASAASDSRKKPRNNNYSSVHDGNRLRQGEASCSSLFQASVKLSRRQYRQIIFISFGATRLLNERPD